MRATMRAQAYRQPRKTFHFTPHYVSYLFFVDRVPLALPGTSTPPAELQHLLAPRYTPACHPEESRECAVFRSVASVNSDRGEPRNLSPLLLARPSLLPDRFRRQLGEQGDSLSNLTAAG